MSKIIKTIPLETLYIIFNRDLTVNDIRLLSIIGGYYLDFVLDKNLEVLLKKPNDFTNSLSFNERLSLLESLGYFESDKINLLQNIKKINSIRNHFAHTIIEDVDDIPLKIKSLVSEMKGKLKIDLNDYKSYQLQIIYCIQSSFLALLKTTNIYDEKIISELQLKSLEKSLEKFRNNIQKK